MGFDAALGLTGLAIAAVGTFVLAANPARAANRWLTVYLTCLGVPFVIFAVSDFVSDRGISYNLMIFQGALFVPAIMAYLLFVGNALTTTAAAPLRWPITRIALVAFGVAGFAAMYLVPYGFWQLPATRTPEGGWSWTSGNLGFWLNFVLYPAYAYALACAVLAYRRTPQGSVSRAQARGYLQAFLTMDVTVLFGNALVLGSQMDVYQIPLSQAAGTLVIFATGILPLAIGSLLIVRAMVRYQLFDFDLKVKWTIQRGTVAAIILGAAIIVGQIAQNYLSGAFGWLAGGIAAGALLFAIRPIEHFAARLSDRAMPKTTGSPDYITYRKLEVYRAAVESEIETHGHDHQEHAVLERLRVKLGISREDADALQREARERVVEASV